ncbi:Universal stress protein [Musa troglodytarum]|uniref:Universal stress protein n=1 Tax=Musa troglodytarum TaxID=320322 RepID=A0A9E7HIF6_9LILI|nr:Universal stress protein [Musa troglodytarum]URE33797.1 Universal stress protein [Musa troglodytarum]URE33801.1 Universal stress protein [Musa troglodytarum]
MQPLEETSRIASFKGERQLPISLPPAYPPNQSSCDASCSTKEEKERMGSDGGHGESFFRLLSVGGRGGEGGSRRWGRKSPRDREEATGWWGESGGGGMVAKKRVIAVIDSSARAKHAMMWALTQVATEGDLLTLLRVVPPDHHHLLRGGGEDDATKLASSLAALCKACKPEVEVEALIIEGAKLATVLSQVKKLEASVLVLSQGKPSPFCCMLRSSSEEFVEQCIGKADCLTLAVRKQSGGVGGYLISTRWQKDFWLLA